LLAARNVESEGLRLLRDLAERDGIVGRGVRRRDPRAQLDLVVGGPTGVQLGLAEVRPTIAFVGANAACAVQRVLALFSQESRPEGARVRCCRILGERVLDVRVPLRAPWRLAPGFAAASVRVVNLPSADRATKFRRKLLRSVSAFALVLSDDGDDEDVIRRLARDLRRSAGVNLKDTPLVVLDPSGAEAQRHAALGMPAAAWAAADALPEALATLLLDVAQGAHWLARPRGAV
jgi:hypothetical protein